MDDAKNGRVLVRNVGRVKEFEGICVIPPGGLGMTSRAHAAQNPNLEIIEEPKAVGLHLYRSTCGYDCFHSVCVLSAGLAEELRKRGLTVARSPFRKDFDQPILQARERTFFCNAGTFEWQGRRIAWPFFDNDRIGKVHLEYLSRNWDYALASSKAIGEGLKASGFPEERILYVPLAVDTETFTPEGPIADLHPGKFLFFLAGALSERKGTDIALAAYAAAFRKSDPVVLLLKNYNYGRHAETEDLLAKYRADGDAPEVAYVYTLKEHWDKDYLASVFRRVAQKGAYLAPSRVEGFGLTPLEAACCGAPVGLTNWAGHTDFLESPMVGFPFKLEPSRWNLPLYLPDEQPRWAEVDVDAVGRWMKAVAKKPPSEAKRLELAAKLRANWSFAKYAERFHGALWQVDNDLLAEQRTTQQAAISAAAKTVAGDETLGIGIPTRSRPVELGMLLTALLLQSKLPAQLAVIDDGGEMAKNPHVQALLQRLREAGTRCDVLVGPNKGQPHSHQMALDHLETDLVLRIDDDLIPATPDFVERLWKLISGHPEVGAVAGVYPRIRDGQRQNLGQLANKPGMRNGLDDLLAGYSGLQIAAYDTDQVIEAEHLYSSWIYRREYLQKVGGFPLCYSRMCFREETDASVRLHLLGRWKLLVDTGAIAWHWMSPTGGMRPEQTRQRKQDDDNLFQQRLTQWRATAGAGVA